MAAKEQHSSLLRVRERRAAPGVTALAWAKNGKFLAVASASGLMLQDDTGLHSIAPGSESSLSVSFDGAKIAACDGNGIWKIFRQSGERVAEGDRAALALWSPVEETLALIRTDQSVQLWQPAGQAPSWIYSAADDVLAAAWSPDGGGLAIGCADGIIRILNPATGRVRRALEGNTQSMRSVCWSPDRSRIAAACDDRVVRVWDTSSGRLVRILEGHTAPAIFGAFTPDPQGSLLVSAAQDGSVRVWRADVWEEVAVRRFRSAGKPILAMHPSESLLAIWNAGESVVELLEIGLQAAYSVDIGQSVHYVNAKIVLVGESGVGKSGLGIRIAESRFRKTESTHGAKFWQLESPALEAPGLSEERIRPELTLWDFAGQPEYHLIHQLFLDDADVALLVYTCDRADEPFRGVEYWAKALKKHLPKHARKYLVAARIDVNPVTAGDKRIASYLSEVGLEAHFATSAKTGRGVPELLRRVMRDIRWSDLARVTMPRLFGFIREVLLERKEAGQVLVSMDELRAQVADAYREREVWREEIDTVVRSLQTRGLVHRLEPAATPAQILLRPELINQYGSSIIQAARRHPKALGAVLERDVVRGRLEFTGVERTGSAEEALILEATVELLVRHQLCFRHMGQLVFPSQLNKARPPFAEGRPRSEVTYQFAGSVEAIYASLVVSLNYTSYFELEECWSYAVEFSRSGRRLGFSMQQTASGSGELDIYFYEGIDKYDRVSFIRYITDHLRRHGIDIKESIRLYCKNPNCGEEVTNRAAIEKRLQAGKTDIRCQVCDSVVEIPRSVEQIYERVEIVRQTVQKMHDETASGTDCAVQEWRTNVEVRGTAMEEGRSIRILHLSDLHIGAVSQDLARASLETDLVKHFGLSRLDYIILSGDIADKALPAEYEVAAAFVDKVAKLFSISPDRMIVVPGNHDVNWDLSEDAFQFVPRRRLPAGGPAGRFVDLGDEGVLVCDESKYKDRFLFFSRHFYRKVFFEPYPLEYKDQFCLLMRPQDRILFLGLNSCWELDHRNRERAGIQPEALAAALDQLNASRCDGWLKIAVWHHPVGVGSFGDAFLGLLARHGFQIGIQGHIHESRRSRYQFDAATSIQILGGGTFSAPQQEQVTGIPLQYSLLTYDAERLNLRVESRKQEHRGGAWVADARYGTADRPLPHEIIRLKRRRALGRGAA